MGLHRAGFDVTGVDINPQPRYPFRFIQADALTVPLDGYDFIWASPPCQGYTLMRHMGKRAGDGAPRLIEPVRERLQATGKPYVIENVIGAPLLKPLLLCGSMFGLGVRRHRLFELSHFVLEPYCAHEPDKWPIAVWGDARREHRGPIAVYGDHPEDCAIHRADDDKPGLTRRAATLKVAQEAMGIDWMDWKTLTQAIPPAYSQWIAERMIQQCKSVTAAR